MRFSDSTHFQIPQPIIYANSYSSPFNSDESLSDEDSSQTFMTPPNILTPSSISNLPSTTDSSLYKNIINTPYTNIPIDRSPHPSQNQTDSLL